MKSFRYLISILFALFVVSGVSTVFASTGGITVATSQQIYHPGQTVIVLGTTAPNVEVNAVLKAPNGTTIAVQSVNTSSTGVYEIDLFTFPTTDTAYGTYSVLVGNSKGFTNSTTIQYEPQLATVYIEIYNPENVPVSGASVTIMGITKTTNSTGVAMFMLPSGTYSVSIVPPSPYVPLTKTITVVAPQTYTFKYTVLVEELQVELTQVNLMYYNGTTYAKVSNPNEIITIGDSMLTGYVTVDFEGVPVSTATVTVTFNGMTESATYNSTIGMYEFTYNISNVPTEGYLMINASYSGYSAMKEIFTDVQLNPLPYFTQINSEINSLTNLINETLTKISDLNSNISTLYNDISTLSSSVSSLSSTASSLSTEVNTLKSDESSLNSTVISLSNTETTLKSDYSSLSGIVYGALAAAIVGLILGIVAIILVLRKIS